VAQIFVQLMERFPFLDTIAFLVIGVLGLKLCSSLYSHFYPTAPLAKILESEHADLALSIFTASIFFVPILTSYFFGIPKKSDE